MYTRREAHRFTPSLFNNNKSVFLHPVFGPDKRWSRRLYSCAQDYIQHECLFPPEKRAECEKGIMADYHYYMGSCFERRLRPRRERVLLVCICSWEMCNRGAPPWTKSKPRPPKWTGEGEGEGGAEAAGGKAMSVVVAVIGRALEM